jgi:hypothetical protein
MELPIHALRSPMVRKYPTHTLAMLHPFGSVTGLDALAEAATFETLTEISEAVFAKNLETRNRGEISGRTLDRKRLLSPTAIV